MRLAEFYQKAIEVGVEADPRGGDEVKKSLERIGLEYQDLSPAAQARFDRDRLTNPYPDTRILNGDEKQEVSSILVGIDMEVGEILLADRLRQTGTPIDLVLSHHPEGSALAGFSQVMGMQADILSLQGISIAHAESMLEKRMGEVERKVMPINVSRAVDAARLLQLPFACIHTPADNCVVSFLQETFDRLQPQRVEDAIRVLMEIPEYEIYAREGVPPRIIAGKTSRRAGKIVVDMTGGTEGALESLSCLAQNGVGTLIVMHMSDKLRKEALKRHFNVIVAGHMASDSLGLNLLLDRVGSREALEIIPCSGFRRVKRTQA